MPLVAGGHGVHGGCYVIKQISPFGFSGFFLRFIIFLFSSLDLILEKNSPFFLGPMLSKLNLAYLSVGYPRYTTSSRAQGFVHDSYN